MVRIKLTYGYIYSLSPTAATPYTPSAAAAQLFAPHQLPMIWQWVVELGLNTMKVEAAD